MPRKVLVILALAGAALLISLWVHGRRQPDIEPSDGVVVVGGDARAGAPRSAAPAPTIVRDDVPPALLTALDLPPTASFRQEVPADGPTSIVCGEVSVDGGTAPYRRFVYNRAAQTGAVDDGTPLFRRFADKICRQQR